MTDSQDVFTRIDQDSERYLEELKDYIRIPSISTDSAYAAEVRRCAEFVVDRMREAGLDPRIIETPNTKKGGHPLVYAERIVDPDKPTLLFYGHYDVQPPDPLDEWRHDPFEPTVEGEQLVARGATDDKGQSYCHIKAVEAIVAERGELPVNVKFLIEGEEESGGEAIDEFVREDGGDLLACDAVVISDSSMYAPGQPSLLYGLKGLCYIELRVDGPDHDLHSGTYGGGVANPANALAHILSKLHDPETGRVLVPGFYDAVEPLEDWEREGFAGLPFNEDDYAASVGVSELRGEEGFTTLERVWGRPTLDVNGVFGGYQGEGAKTVLPAWAGAKLSMRLVPCQTPEEIADKVIAYIEENAPAGVRVQAEFLHGAVPVRVSLDGEIAEAAVAAQEDVWGKAPVKVREGGTIPIVATFADVLSVPVLLMGFGLNDDRLHSPNEKFDIPNFYAGIRTTVRLLDRVGGVAS